MAFFTTIHLPNQVQINILHEYRLKIDLRIEVRVKEIN